MINETLEDIPKSENPKLLILAGPNGSGKSTAYAKLTQDISKLPETLIEATQIYVCPDDIAKLDEFVNEYLNLEDRAYAAAIRAEEMREDFLESGISFTFETVLSHPSKLDFIERAAKKGYQIDTIYVSTKDPEINLTRVAKRVVQGGHDVDSEKVKLRYERSMKLAGKLMFLSNYGILIDNSETIGAKIYLLKEEDIINLFEKGIRPNWIDNVARDLKIQPSIINFKDNEITYADYTKEKINREDLMDKISNRSLLLNLNKSIEKL